ncbi:MAG: serine/threonine-protein phosphatase [Bacteroidales bacterium]|nr:serine/threonine-protein phosphatase [Bacteroidales bacterium]
MAKLIKGLFNKKEDSEEETMPISDDLLKAANSIHQVSPPQLNVGSGYSVGMERDHNEDTLYTFSSVIADGVGEFQFGLYIVADGMGGHQHGEVASGAAVRAFSEYIIRNVYLELLSMKPSEMESSIYEAMEKAVDLAQEAVTIDAPGGGTTLSGMMFFGGRCFIAHVGDSRIYKISNDGVLETVTNDHSLVNRLIELGKITEEEAAVHPQRNVLYQAIGQSDALNPDFNTITLKSSEKIMICSDGLWGVVKDEDMQTIISESKNLVEACQKLVSEANQNGGPDNISVILVQEIA